MVWNGARRTGCMLGALTALLPLVAAAHASRVVPRDELWQAWRIDPFTSIALVLTAWLYWRGSARLDRIAVRSARPAVYSRNQRALFWSGMAVFALALASPLDTMTGTVFSAHMTQHMLLIAVAPPLVLAGRPLPALVNGLPLRVRKGTTNVSRKIPAVRGAASFLALPVVAWLVHSAALWFWHEPTLYQAAVRTEWIHLLEHVSFVFTALLFWWSIVPIHGHSSTLAPGWAVLALFAMGMQGGALGALLTFSGDLWYPVYDGRSELWGFSAMSDQRLAGLIMWIPAGSAYVAAALIVLGRWLSDESQQVPGRREYIATGMGE